MLNFRDLPLRTKGLVVVSIPMILFLIVVAAFYVAQRYEGTADEWTMETIRAHDLIEAIRSRWEMAETSATAYVATGNATCLKPLQQARQQLLALFSNLQEMSHTAEHRQRIAGVQTRVLNRLAELDRMAAMGGALGPSRAAEVLSGAPGNQNRVRDEVAALTQAQDKILNARLDDENRARLIITAVIIGGILLALAGGVFAMLLFTNTISRRVQAVDQNARRLARGEPLQPLGPGNDDIGHLGASLGEAGVLLAERQRQLERSAAELEQRVRERTEELERTNAALAEEVAQRARAEDQLADAKRRFEAIIEASPLAIIGTDMDMNVIGWNRAAEEMFGWQTEEVLGRPLPTIPDEEREHADTLHARAKAGEALAAQDVRWRRRDGTPLDVRLWTAPLRGTDGVMHGTIAVLTDVTSQRRLEQQLAQSQKMEAIGRLAGGVAHDFNNIITVISGYGQMLLEGVQKNPVLREAAEEVLNSADRAAALAGQLLLFSRRQMIRPRVIDLNALVSNTQRLLARVIGEDIELRTVLDPDLGPVRADPGQMEQVLMNLAINARDAMPKGGKLFIETSRVRLDEIHAAMHVAVPPGEYALLAVSDTGTGMDAETKAHLFEPFFTTKEKGKGTGLGLSTVYGIVKQHGGDIWVYSEPGKGTTFKIYLPQATEPAAAEQERRKVEPARRGTETILLVEDEAGVRKLVCEILQQRGYRVLEAASGEQALEIAAREEHIDLLATDVVMPGIGGRDLARELSSKRPRLRVLFLSGYTDEVVAGQGILTSESDFLQKPFAPEALARKVREILDRPAKNGAD